MSLLIGAEGSSYGWYGLLAGASIVFFAFIGFDVVATTAEETKNPQRDVPRGILASLAIVTVLYVAVTVVLSGMVHYTELSEAATASHANLATAFAANGVTWAAKVISIGALAGLTTVVMVLMLGQTRVLFAMSRDGLLPRPLAKNRAARHPGADHGLVGVLIAMAASVFPIDKLEEMVNVGTLFAFVLVSAGVIVLRRTQARPGPRLPGAVGAAAADRGDRGLPVADAEPDRTDLDPLRDLDGAGRRHLLRVRPPTLGARRPAGRPAVGCALALYKRTICV